MDAVIGFANAVFQPLIDLGAAPMMTIVLTVIALLFKVKFTKALEGGLKLGIAITGIGAIINILTTAFSSAMTTFVESTGLQLTVTDVGWAPLATITWGSPYTLYFLMVLVIVNIAMIVLAKTNTIDVDIFDVWHLAFVGLACIYFGANIVVATLLVVFVGVMKIMNSDLMKPTFNDLLGAPEENPMTTTHMNYMMNPLAMLLNKIIDTMVNDGLTDAFNNYHMGITAENVCDQWGITREELDAFGVASQQKTEAAQASGRFDAEIVPVPVKVKKEIVEFKKDEFPRAGSTPEGLAKLKGAFPVGPEGVEDQIVHTFQPTEIHEADTRKHVQRVTAGNASGINDGAAAIVLASGEAVKKYNLKPMAKLIGWGQGGVDPKIMGVGPVPASRQAMAKAGVTIDDIDLVEANEAFAAQSIAVARELHFDMSKVNVNGGAISIGHPVGCSGARIIVTLLHEMLKREDAKKGLATLCIGGGQGVATVFEKC
mgnify:CR=1 FL=1